MPLMTPPSFPPGRVVTTLGVWEPGARIERDRLTVLWPGCSGPTRPVSFGSTCPTGSRVGKPPRAELSARSGWCGGAQRCAHIFLG